MTTTPQWDKAANVEAQLKEQQEKMDEALREAEKRLRTPDARIRTGRSGLGRDP